MANRDMKLNVLVNLHNRMTPGVNRIVGEFDRIGKAARRIGAVGTILAGLSFIGPMHEAAAFQSQLLDIAGTAELSGKAAFAFADENRRKYEELAFHIGQTSHNIAEGVGIMIAAGLTTDEIDASIEGIEKATTAANAAGGEMARLGASLIQNLKLPADQTKDALGALMVAGKEGSFEMADMAREFPALTSGFANMGITGRAAVNSMGAFLEVVRKGTATSSEAATNLKNLVAEIQSPLVVRKFANMGVDIQAVMKDAIVKGIDPLEAAIQKAGDVAGISSAQISQYMQEAQERGLKGAEAIASVQEKLEKLGRAGGLAKIFGNQMSRDAVVAILANAEEYNRIKNKVAAATGEIIDKDAATRMQGFAVQLTTLGEIGTQSAREIGYAFNEWLPDINAGLAFLLENFRKTDAATGGFLRKMLGFGALATFTAVAIGALGLALPLVTAGFTALGAVIGIILTPVGLIIGLLAGTGLLIYKNWDKVAPKLAKFWNTLKRSSSQAWNNIKSTWARLAPSMSQLWDTISVKAGDAWQWLEQAGVTAWEGLSAAWEGFKPSLQGISESLQRTFGNLGGVWKNIKGISSGLMELGVSIARLMGIGDGTGQGIARWLGELAGGFEQLAALGLEGLSQALWVISGAIRTILDLLNGKTPNWESYFPKWLVSLINDISSGINNIRSGLEWLSGKEYTTNRINSILDRAAQMPPQDTNIGRNSMSWRPADDFFRNMALPPQKIDNKVEVRVKVDGPGTASATVNSTKAAPVTSDGGLAVGRP